MSHSIARDGNRTNAAINYADCANGDAISFSLSLASRGSFTLEVWAGASCDVQSYRTSSDSTECWKVYAASPTSNSPVVRVPVRSILYGRTLASGSSSTVVDTSEGGASSTTSSDPDVPDACNDKSGSTAAQTITLYFMFVDGGEVAQGTITQWGATYKLVAPAPPDHVSAGVGEDLLVVEFGYDDTSADATTNGYQFFCDPAPGSAAAADAGVLPGDAGTTLTSCSVSSKLIPGTRVDKALQSQRCGSAESTASSGMATSLINGVAYNVAVAATDSYENVGKLSETACGVPQPVTGFYEAYRNAGGQAGGGFCSFSGRREPTTLSLVVGFGACLFCRRRNKRTPSKPGSNVHAQTPRVFIALEHGTPWHWGWALAHQIGCNHCIVVVQQSEESHFEFTRRVERAARAIVGCNTVSVLCAWRVATRQLVGFRFSAVGDLVLHMKRAESAGAAHDASGSGQRERASKIDLAWVPWTG